MREVDRIASLLTQTYHGDAVGFAWFGPALRPMLRGLSPAAAVQRPLRHRHTIWAIVRHLAANIRLRARETTDRSLELSATAGWPPAPEPSVPTWADALGALDARYETLLERLDGLDDAQLAQPLVGRPYDVYAMLHGSIHHTVYHTAQIAVLREAADSPAA